MIQRDFILRAINLESAVTDHENHETPAKFKKAYGCTRKQYENALNDLDKKVKSCKIFN